MCLDFVLDNKKVGEKPSISVSYEVRADAEHHARLTGLANFMYLGIVGHRVLQDSSTVCRIAWISVPSFATVGGMSHCSGTTTGIHSGYGLQDGPCWMGEPNLCGLKLMAVSSKAVELQPKYKRNPPSKKHQ